MKLKLQLKSVGRCESSTQYETQVAALKKAEDSMLGLEFDDAAAVFSGTDQHKTSSLSIVDEESTQISSKVGILGEKSGSQHD